MAAKKKTPGKPSRFLTSWQKLSFMQKIQKEARANGIPKMTTASHEWYMNRVKSTHRIDKQKLLTDPKLAKRPEPLIGRMFMYLYDPKHRETLPYYDRFPLILMVGPAKGGWYGINLHYLPPTLRGVFFDKLMSIANNKRYDATTKLKLSYGVLKGVAKFKEFAPCFKHYLADHVESQISEVLPQDWELALFLPTDQFVYNTRQTVWAKSKKQIGL